MNKEIEERLKALENMPLSKLEHRHCVDCGNALFYKNATYMGGGPDWSPFNGRLVNGQLHCDNCARLHDPPPPRANHTHEEIKKAK